MVFCKICGNIAVLIDSEDELDKFRCKSCEYNFWRYRASEPQSSDELAINTCASKRLPNLTNPSISNNPNHESLPKNTITHTLPKKSNTHRKDSTGFEGIGDLFSSKNDNSALMELAGYFPGRHTCGYCGRGTDYACDVPKCNNVGGKRGICERCQKSGKAIRNYKFIATKSGWIMSRGRLFPDGWKCLNCGWSD